MSTTIDGSDPYYGWSCALAGKLVPGSIEHRDAFCRMLLDTYNPYRPAIMDWPALSEAELARLAGLPFWDTAVAIEDRAALRMGWQADNIEDPLIREALKLNAAEERRHKEVLGHMLAFYGIALPLQPTHVKPSDPEFGFLRTGYGECINSFFAFGLFALAEKSGFFPAALVAVFEPVVQEETRHILFFANYLAWRRAQSRGLARLRFEMIALAALADQVFARLATAVAVRRRRRRMRSNFLTSGVGAVSGRLDLPGFLALCLSENDRRMAGYDGRLLRPAMMPALVRMVLRFFG